MPHFLVDVRDELTIYVVVITSTIYAKRYLTFTVAVDVPSRCRECAHARGHDFLSRITVLLTVPAPGGQPFATTADPCVSDLCLCLSHSEYHCYFVHSSLSRSSLDGPASWFVVSWFPHAPQCFAADGDELEADSSLELRSDSSHPPLAQCELCLVESEVFDFACTSSASSSSKRCISLRSDIPSYIS